MADGKVGVYRAGQCGGGFRYFVCTGKKHVQVDYNPDDEKILQTIFIRDCNDIECLNQNGFILDHIRDAAMEV